MVAFADDQEWPQDLSLDDVAMLASGGDPEAMPEIWQRVIPQVYRVAGSVCAKYAATPHVETEDIIQSVLAQVPKLIRRYKPEKAKSFDQYFYFTVYRATQDELRKLDPLGVRIPQKSPYPSFQHLSGVNTDPLAVENLVLGGLCNLDRGEHADLTPGYTGKALRKKHGATCLSSDYAERRRHIK